VSDDIECEARWYDEFANALETLVPRYRRAAELLRFAGRDLPAGELAAFRAELAGVTRRTIGAATLATYLAGNPPGSGLDDPE
jgi:hypothetical protein